MAQPPRGAQRVEPDQIRGWAPKSQEEFEARLREVPPINPFLLSRWLELGLPPGGGTEQNGPANDKPEWGVA